MKIMSRPWVVVVCASLLHFAFIFLGLKSPLVDSRVYLHFTNTWFDHFIQWDSQWYATIGKYGYKFPLPVQKTFVPAGNTYPFSPELRATVFFPLVPIIVHFLGPIGTMLLTNMIFVLTIPIMYTLFRKVMNHEKALWGIVLYSVNPALIYESVLYTESYLIFFSLLVLYGISKGTKAGLIMAYVAGFLSVLAHETGLFMAIFSIRYLRTKEYWKALMFIGSVIAGWAVYLGYLLIKFGQPFIVFSAERSWGRVWKFPGASFIDDWTLRKTHHNVYIDLFCMTLLSVIAISYIYSTIKTDHGFKPTENISVISFETGAWVLVNLLICLTTYLNGNPLASATRLISVLWPMYSFVWLKGTQRQQLVWNISCLFTFSFVGYLGVSFYTHGYFFE
ncbi:hypothetical protein [Alicyclobacillus fodiniaquatilis]|uniref:Mannosyltransferase PIG-V n=1 Tax=Alicyclobacillus fodiniaquatilis TaxID=1661150 RepID=A0ABW4JKF4_9BACL